ncbi:MULTISPECIES: hypothetical protein [Cobetia]|uniref:hypothetical protein n=1 Tax=Cobetia TaxID=204286 RepID=UPI0011155BBE|nr:MULTISPECIES: hypothetical protein [Cobetia]
MEFISFTCQFILPLLALCATVKYGSHQRRKSSREDLRDLFSLININSNTRTTEELDLIKNQFTYIFNFEIRTETLDLITVKKNDYKFLNYCLKNKKLLRTSDCLITFSNIEYKTRASVFIWLAILTLNYIVFAILSSSLKSETVEIVTKLLSLQASSEFLKSIVFFSAMVVAYIVGRKIIKATFYRQLLLRKKYIDTPVVSQVERNKILKEIKKF